MKPSILILPLIFCCFISCSKSAENSTFIRVQNSTMQDFKEVITNNKSFLNVAASDTTSYKSYNKAVASFITLIDNDNDTAFAGSIPIDDPIPTLSSGRYTLKVFIDTSAYYGYNCKYIKD